MTALEDLPVLFVDCQSTGATPRLGSLMELGWAVGAAAQPEPSIQEASLVRLPPGERVPRAVRRITGIDEEALSGAPSAPEVISRLWSCVQERFPDAPTVPTAIHYARFERAWLSDLLGDRVERLDIVCVHEVARRLLPDLPRRNLRALSGYFGFSADLLRRAEGHVAATAFAWSHLVTALAERGVTTWSELSTWLRETKVPKANATRGFPIERKKRLGLPDRPGVYRLLRLGGDVLYVGKATSLKKRVNSYFQKRRGYGERHLEMLSQVRDISVTETASVVEAALLEAELIKRAPPPYNVALREEARSIWFLSRDFEARSRCAGPTHPIGPMPSRWALSNVGPLCRWLCSTGEPDMGEIQAALGLPVGHRLTEEAAVEGARRARSRMAVHTSASETAGPRWQLRAAARALWQDRIARGLAPIPPSPANEEDAPWDPERVAIELERALLGVGQLLRRASALALLAESKVAFGGDSDGSRRVLTLGGACVVNAEDWSGEPVALDHPPSARWERLATLDLARYDLLRVLVTELKRLASLSETELGMALPGGRYIDDAGMRRLLAWL